MLSQFNWQGPVITGILVYLAIALDSMVLWIVTVVWLLISIAALIIDR